MLAVCFLQELERETRKKVEAEVVDDLQMPQQLKEKSCNAISHFNVHKSTRIRESTHKYQNHRKIFNQSLHFVDAKSIGKLAGNWALLF